MKPNKSLDEKEVPLEGLHSQFHYKRQEDTEN